tara:strand:- start:9732 stop:10724 length:993 start_codon:yes stop_codon:yes gene_type:complete
MARHLIIGNNAAATGANSEVNLAVNVQKLSAKGPVAIAPGDTVADSDSIRLVQGTGGVNYYSPWIKGRNVVSYSGKSASAPVSQSSTIVVAAAATNTTAIDMTVKFVNKTNGQADPFDARSYTISTIDTGINTKAEIGENLAGLMLSSYDVAGGASITTTQSDDLPHFVKSIAWDDTDTLTFVGYDKGEVKQNGQIAEHQSVFEIFVENASSAAAGGQLTIATGTSASEGIGGGFFVREMEEIAQGVGFGYYDRRNLPIQPALTSVTATNYDMYSIVASKDGSTTSAINGVDNLIEIVVAFDPATAGLTSALEGKLNPYLNSVGFGSVNL